MRTKHQRESMQNRTWLMSFSDLLTILLTFFILLMSVSYLHMNKMRDLSLSAGDAFGIKMKQDRRTDLIRTIGEYDGIKVSTVKGGISVILPEALVYRSGSADVIHRDALRRIGGKLKTTEGLIRVEGHTDNRPVMNGHFTSNWELSTQRAVNVAKFLIEDCGVEPERLAAAGYADSKPVASNDTPEGRALNRRVNMIISLK